MAVKPTRKPKPPVEWPAVKGCTLVYAPTKQAGEYAALACNLFRGCGHCCAYCYVPRVGHMTRASFDAGAADRAAFRKGIRREAAKYQMAGVTEQVMLSFMTDPYHPFDTSLTRETLEILIDHGMGVCTLTKGGTRALRDLDLFRPDQDAFATTLTSLDDNFSLKWERNAPLPSDRIEALKRFFERGIYTWSSLEPTLNIEASLAIIRETHGFVNRYKIGKANDCGALTKTTDWRDYTLRAIDLCHQVGAAHYIKKDLQMYLPPGYHNPMRVPQFHFERPTE
jgi:hypothetical protein